MIGKNLFWLLILGQAIINESRHLPVGQRLPVLSIEGKGDVKKCDTNYVKMFHMPKQKKHILCFHLQFHWKIDHTFQVRMM